MWSAWHYTHPSSPPPLKLHVVLQSITRDGHGPLSISPQSLSLGHTSITSRRPVAADNHQQPISNQNCSPQSVADCSPTGRRVVGNQLPITRRLIIEHTSHFGTWSATISRVIADRSPTVWREVICIIFWITLQKKFLHFYDHTWTVSWIHVGISFEMRVIQLIM